MNSISDNETLFKYGRPDTTATALSDDRGVIPYRKELNKITGGVKESILLTQAMYWGKIQLRGGNDRFYKFITPCKHDWYNEGDSWTEELGFTRREFTTALKKIGFKRGKNNNKLECEEDAYIIYFTDKDRLTWWIVNWTKINEDLDELYTTKEDDPLIDNMLITKVNDKRGITIPYTENTNTENTSTTTTISSSCLDKEIKESYKDILGVDKVAGSHKKYITNLCSRGMSVKVILEAIEETKMANSPSWRYLFTILKRYEDNNLYTLEQVEKDRNKQKGKELYKEENREICRDF